MSQIFGNLSQSTSEIKTYTIDFTSVLPSGGTVTAGTATHTPPGNGTAGSVTVEVTSPYVYVTVGPLATTGIHYIDTAATFDEGDISAQRLAIDVFYPPSTARAGMADLITELRGLTEAGANDYTIANNVYWTDRQLQDILDRRVTKFDFEPMMMVPARASGGYTYTDYYIGRKWIEQEAAGTTIFKIQDYNGSAIGTALYSIDYNVGKITFATDQGSPIAYMVTCSCYDINAAAADVWRKKSSHYASAYDFSTDNHSVKREQLYTHALKQVDYFLGLSNDGVGSIQLERADDPGW